jgi:hypothetical protein
LRWLAGEGSLEWIHLSQDRDRWRALVKTVMNLGFWRHGCNFQCNGRQVAQQTPGTLHRLAWSWLLSNAFVFYLLHTLKYGLIHSVKYH